MHCEAETHHNNHHGVDPGVDPSRVRSAPAQVEPDSQDNHPTSHHPIDATLWGEQAGQYRASWEFADPCREATLDGSPNPHRA